MKQIAITFEQAKRIDLLAVLREIDFESFQFSVGCAPVSCDGHSRWLSSAETSVARLSMNKISKATFQ
ncbi:MAG: hypothetical protein J7576_09860 [Siphonobacter aquaeclarae]|nr:hypothetical protein [Siphonobacter aquaeclarae]